MGGGNKWSDDARMSKPVDVISAVAELRKAGDGGGGSFEEAATFCVTKRELRFRLLEGASVAVGDKVHLGPGATVIAAGGAVGEVTEPWSKPMQACLEMGYRMAGAVTDLDPFAGSGTVLVAGERAQAA